MKNIINIFKRDIKKIIINPFAVMLLIGLIILPSLYAWLNIEASWEPYDRTGNIKVAVTNEDIGDDFDNVEIKIGDDIIKELKANSDIGWQFVNKDELLNGVKSGKYYAGIIIPSDFSSKFLSVTTESINKPNLEYYINDKINAIAPKITDAGITSLETQINQTVIETISNILLTTIKTIDQGIVEYDAIGKTVKFLEETSKDMDELLTIMDLIIVQEKPISQGVNSLDSSLTSLQEILTQASNEIPKTQNTINTTEELTNTIFSNISLNIQDFQKDLETMISSIDTVTKKVTDAEITIEQALKEIGNKLQNLNSKITSLAEDINSLNKKLPQPLQGLSDIYTKLTNIGSIISEQKSVIDKTVNTISKDQLVKILNEVKDKINSQISLINTIKTSYDNEIKPLLSGIESSTKLSLEKMNSSFKSANSAIAYIKKAINGTNLILDSSTETLTHIKELISANKAQIDESIETINKEIKKTEIQTIVETITANPHLASDFFSNPTNIEENRLYPVANYGSAMTPFYIVLCLWVGSMFLMSVLKTKVKEDDKIKNIKSYEAYFGRGMTYMVLAILQGIFASVGALLILRITTVHPILFILMCILTSIVFSAIIYSLVAGVGNIGKAIAIVLLVIQVAGAGGTFPVELTPDFFGAINPIMPFTYAINAVRETVAGIYTENFVRDIIILLIFIPISVSIGLILNKKLKKFNKKFEDKLEETDIII